MHASSRNPGASGPEAGTGTPADWPLDGGPASTVPREGTEGPLDLTEAVAARQAQPLEREIELLRRRLATQPVIEQAKGVLMSHYGFGADAAFAALSSWSQHTNTKLYLLAGELLEAASDNSGRRGGRLDGFLSRLPSPGHEGL